MKEEIIRFRARLKVKQALKKLAEKSDMTLSEYLTRLCEEAIKAKKKL